MCLWAPSAYAVWVRKILWWMALLSLAASAFAFLLPLPAAPPQPAPVVTAVGSAEGLLPSRCPKGTLEDHGVCVPVPAAATAAEIGANDSIPKLPERPQSLDAYLLPALGAPKLAIQSPPKEVGDGSVSPALVLAVTAGANVVHHVRSTEGVTFTPAKVIAESSEGGWVLLSQTERRTAFESTTLFLYTGLTPKPTPAADGPSLMLGLTRGGELSVAARRMRPGKKAELNTDAWNSAQSVATDIRNVLPLKP